MKKIVAFSLVSLLVTYLWASDPELKVLVRESQPFDRGASLTASIDAIITSNKGKKTYMRYNMYTTRTKDKIEAMIAFSQPESYDGTRIFTSVPVAGGIPNVIVKFKSFFATMKIPFLNPKISFFGMDFSSGDMNPRNATFDTYTLVDTIVLENGSPGYVVEAIQMEDKQYERVLYYLDLNKKLIVRTEMFNKKNEMIKLMEVLECRQIQDIWSATKIQMTDLDSGSNTVLLYTDLIYHEDNKPYVNMVFLKDGKPQD